MLDKQTHPKNKRTKKEKKKHSDINYTNQSSLTCIIIPDFKELRNVSCT